MKTVITGLGFLSQAVYQEARKGSEYVSQVSLRTGTDIRNLDHCRAAVRGASVCIHTAARTHVGFSIDGSIDERRDFILTNHLGTFNMLEACREQGVKLLHISSSEVYGTNQHPGEEQTEAHPLCPDGGPYAVSKAAADMACQMAHKIWGQDVVIIRPFNLFGPGQSNEKLIPRFIGQALAGEPMTVYGGGRQKRDFVHVSDAARAICGLRAAPAGSAFNIGTGNSYSILDVVHLIKEAVPSSGWMSASPRPNDLPELRGSFVRLHDFIGWKPEKELDQESIAELVDWYKANGPVEPSQSGEHLTRLS